MGLFEPQHLLLILLIALIIFGPGKVAELGGSLGRSVRDFKRAMAEPETPSAPAQANPTPQAPAQLTVTPAQETASTVKQPEQERV